MSSSFLETNPSTRVQATLLLAHGAGAPMDSDYMNQLAEALAARGIRVLRFEFPYMATRRAGGGKRPPNPMPVLQDSFREHYRAGPQPLYIGGKSMGGGLPACLLTSCSRQG